MTSGVVSAANGQYNGRVLYSGNCAYPRSGYTALRRPTSHETPSFSHPLVFVTWTKTKCASCLGAIAPSTAMIATKPAMWSTPDYVSI
jgi:hypothetical protein